jgi:hypothetical protein
VLLHEVQTFDDHEVALRYDANDLALTALVIAANDEHAVTLADPGH